jgi:hypothetical protein
MTLRVLPDGSRVTGLSLGLLFESDSNLFFGMLEPERETKLTFLSPLRAGVARADGRCIKAESEWWEGLLRGVGCWVFSSERFFGWVAVVLLSEAASGLIDGSELMTMTSGAVVVIGMEFRGRPRPRFAGATGASVVRSS